MDTSQILRPRQIHPCNLPFDGRHGLGTGLVSLPGARSPGHERDRVVTLLTYLVAFLIGFALWHKKLRGLPLRPMLCAVALAAGGCNLGFVMGTLAGEVTRVLLLFYLSPLWTVIFARLLLGERLNSTGAFIMAVSLSGACIMLWNPAAGLPWPHSTAEWLGLGAGICFCAVQCPDQENQRYPDGTEGARGFCRRDGLERAWPGPLCRARPGSLKPPPG